MRIAATSAQDDGNASSAPMRPSSRSGKEPSSVRVNHAARSVLSSVVQSTSSLWKLHVDLQVNAQPKRPYETYKLVDDIVMRNSTRTCITGSPVPPC